VGDDPFEQEFPEDLSEDFIRIDVRELSAGLRRSILRRRSIAVFRLFALRHGWRVFHLLFEEPLCAV
jgi:hypothetical protein